MEGDAQLVAALTGVPVVDEAIRRSEECFWHRIVERQFLLTHIPDGSVGVELGVYTGMFSALLAHDKKIRQVTFVDPWWLKHGESFPRRWKDYSDWGKIATRKAYALATERIRSCGLEGRAIVVGYAERWLAAQPDASLDWAYLDTVHTYRQTMQELGLLDKKLTAHGIIIGDDWDFDGIFFAVNDFVKTHDFQVMFCDVRNQWMLRRSQYPPYDYKADFAAAAMERPTRLYNAGLTPYPE